MKIFDAHTHVRFGKEGFEPLYRVAKRLNYDKINILSCQCDGDLLQNLSCAVCKIRYPQMTYAFGGLDYVTGRDFLTQARSLREMGFDGVKMLEGKPATRKKLQIPLDDERYDPLYSFLEETQFPVLMHVADPGTFWDRDRIPDWAVERGWYYDESFVPYAQYYTEVENVLRKHPRLHAIFAHFFFLSEEPSHAQTFLDTHPNVSLDITAGIEMYENFSEDPALWREFFIRNADRIIFGTDSTDMPPPTDPDVMAIDQHNEMELRFLQTDGVILHYDMKLHGLGLPESVREKILYRNFIAYVGDKPKQVNKDILRREAESLRAFIADGQTRAELDELFQDLNES